MARRYGINPRFEKDLKIVQPLHTVRNLHLNPLRVTANNGYEYSVKFINMSRYDIAVMTQDGMVMHCPADYQVLENKCYFATKYVFGSHVTLPWRTIQENEVLSDSQVSELHGAYETYRMNHGLGSTVEIEFRYEIDVTDLPLLPHGIYVPMTGTHLHVFDRNSDPSELHHYGRSRYADGFDLTTEDANQDGGVPDATVRVVAYIVRDVKETRPVIMTGQFGIQILHPIQDWARPEGIHIAIAGNWSTQDNRKLPTFEFIPREEFREKGVFLDVSELRTHMAQMAKKSDKNTLDEMLSQLDGLMGNNKPKPKAPADDKATQWDKLLQIKLFSTDLTLDHVLQGLDIANKIKDLLGKLAK